MKKLLYFALILVLIASASMFGAMAPTQEEETELRYVDAPLISTYASETINYTTKEYTNIFTDGNAPLYTKAGSIQNACGAVAGSQIVAFYDKYYPELIPGWDSYYPSNGKYRLQNSTYITPLMNELYNLMQINVQSPGVSESDFKSGLQTYFTNHGYSASFQDVKTTYAVSTTESKAAFRSNKLIVLFTTPGEVYDISETANRDTIIPYTYSANHIMIAYGYVEVHYYNTAGWFRSDYYLIVATGWDNPSTAYFRINSNNLLAAYVINVA